MVKSVKNSKNIQDTNSNLHFLESYFWTKISVGYKKIFLWQTLVLLSATRFHQNFLFWHLQIGFEKMAGQRLQNSQYNCLKENQMDLKNKWFNSKWNLKVILLKDIPFADKLFLAGTRVSIGVSISPTICSTLLSNLSLKDVSMIVESLLMDKSDGSK